MRFTASPSARVDKICEEMKSKLDKKYGDLTKKQVQIKGNRDPKKSVVNLSSIKLNDDECDILEKGIKFVAVHRRIPIEEIICAIEDTVTTLP